MSGPRDEGSAPRGRLVRSVLWLSVSLVVSKFSTLIALFVLGRYLGEDHFGRFALAIAVPAALEAIADLGLSAAVVREGARHRGQLTALAVGAIAPKILLSGVFVALTAGACWVLQLSPEVSEAAFYVAVARAFDSLTHLARAIFRATEQMQYDAASYTLDGFVRLTLVAYGILGGFGVIGFAKTFAVAALITMAGTWAFTAHRFLRTPRTARSPLPLILAGLPLAVVWLLDSAAIRVGMIAAGAELGGAAVGGLAAGVRIIEPVLAVAAVLGAAVLPLATRHIQEQRSTLPWLLPASVRIAAVASGVATLVLNGLAHTIILAVFGPSFARAGDLLAVLALAVVPLFIRTVLIAFLIAMRLQGRLIAVQAVGVGVNLVVSLWLLPSMGPLAAVLGLIAGEWVAVVGATIAIRPLRDVERGRALLVLPALAAGLAVILATRAAGELASTAVGLVVFGVTVRMANVIDERDLAYARASIPLIGRVSRLSSTK